MSSTLETESDRTRHFYPTAMDTLLLSDFPNLSDLIDPKDTFLVKNLQKKSLERASFLLGLASGYSSLTFPCFLFCCL